MERKGEQGRPRLRALAVPSLGGPEHVSRRSASKLPIHFPGFEIFHSLKGVYHELNPVSVNTTIAFRFLEGAERWLLCFKNHDNRS